MTATELYRQGKLGAAIQAVGAELRDNPADQKRRTFLFELLCFAGEYDRAEKHLDVLASAGIDAATGGLLYRAAIAAERSRNDLFAKQDYPLTAADAVRGTLNGKPFDSLEDADPRIGPRLEVYTAGQYMWLPLAHIESIEIQAPKRLRDLLWAPCLVHTGPKFKILGVGRSPGARAGSVQLPPRRRRGPFGPCYCVGGAGGRRRNSVRAEDPAGGRRGVPTPGTAASGDRGSRRNPAKPCHYAMIC